MHQYLRCGKLPFIVLAMFTHLCCCVDGFVTTCPLSCLCALLLVAREHLIDTCRRVQAKKASGVEDSPNVSWAQINSSVSEDSIAPSALGNYL